MKFISNIIVRLLQALIRIYALIVSPFLGANCRFHPTCSAYARESLEKHGLLKGLILSITRIFRCNPWHSCAHHDPVPETFPRFFHWPIDWPRLIRYKRKAHTKNHPSSPDKKGSKIP